VTLAEVTPFNAVWAVAVTPAQRMIANIAHEITLPIAMRRSGAGRTILESNMGNSFPIAELIPASSIRAFLLGSEEGLILAFK
jgi:methyl coenzyme M reductase subunit C